MGEDENFFPALDERELKDGTMKLVSVEGTPILLIKQFSQIFAIDNRCPHQGCGFSGGTLEGLIIICPCHDWRFDLRSGAYEEEPAMKLTKFEWKIKDGKIWVKLED
ncbi:MAG: Rieske (2Fe-2S) protein [Candidatus Bathyarchaeia archaeon]|jgi:3-phenylpropionate/trans-cinnamate dioxygenase ferredoxin subunit